MDFSDSGSGLLRAAATYQRYTAARGRLRRPRRQQRRQGLGTKGFRAAAAKTA